MPYVSACGTNDKQMPDMDNHRAFYSAARGALPKYLFDTYLRYKQGTRAIVSWLLSQNPSTAVQAAKVSIGDLWDLSRAVRSRSTPLPETIAFHFRETISARKRLTHYFREKEGTSLAGQSTIDHEFFTTSLSQIYAILCNCDVSHHHNVDEEKNGRSRSTDEPEKNGQSRSVDDASRNVFEILEVSQSASTGYEALDTEHCDACHDTAAVAAGNSPDTTEIVDDQLGETLELMRIFKDIRDVCDTVNKSWEQAARGEIPMVLAAFASNVGFTLLKSYESQVQLWWDIKDPKALHERVHGITAQPNSSLQGSQEASVFDLGVAEEHREIWNTLLRFKEVAPLHSTRVKIPDYQNVAKFVIDDRKRNTESISVLLCCIADLAASGTSNAIVQRGTPTFSDVVRCLGENTESSCPLRCTTGLMMLYEGFQSFLWPAGRTNMTKLNPRVQALRFAEEVRESLATVLGDSTMPCRCCYTLAANLEAFQLDVEAFLKEKKFNLYFQAPWVCGNHVMEILETAFSYGMRLCSYRHYFGSILHLYNLLTCLGQMLHIPVLETLCDVFGDTVFPGGRPKNKFSACFLRFKGGRLKKSHTHRKEWHLVIPKINAREAAGFGLPNEPVDSRFQAKRLSILHHVKDRDYNLDEDIWDKVYKSNRQGTKSSLNSAESGGSTHKSTSDDRGNRRRDSGCYMDDQTQDKLLDLQSAILASELTISPLNPLPIGRINFFKIYLAAVRAVSKISDGHHEDQEAGRHCLCFVDELIRRGDEVTTDKFNGKLTPFGYKGLIKCCEDAMVEAFDTRDGNWSRYMWAQL